MCQIKMCQLQHLQGASFHRQLSQQGLPNIADVNIYEVMVIMNERKIFISPLEIVETHSRKLKGVKFFENCSK